MTISTGYERWDSPKPMTRFRDLPPEEQAKIKPRRQVPATEEIAASQMVTWEPNEVDGGKNLLASMVGRCGDRQATVRYYQGGRPPTPYRIEWSGADWSQEKSGQPKRVLRTARPYDRSEVERLLESWLRGEAEWPTVEQVEAGAPS